MSPICQCPTICAIRKTFRSPSLVTEHSQSYPADWVQARFLLAKLNPSTTHASEDTFSAASGELIYTDDVSLQACMPRATLTDMC